MARRTPGHRNREDNDMITDETAKIYRMGIAAPTGEHGTEAAGDIVAIATTTGGPCGDRPDHIWQFRRELRSYDKTTYEYACDRCYVRHYETGESVRAPARAAKVQQAMAANGGAKVLDMGEHMGRRERREAERNRRKVVANMQRERASAGTAVAVQREL